MKQAANQARSPQHGRLLGIALLFFLVSGALMGCHLVQPVEPQFEQTARRGYAISSALVVDLEAINSGTLSEEERAARTREALRRAKSVKKAFADIHAVAEESVADEPEPEGGE